MIVTVNGTEREVADGTTAAELLDATVGSRRGSAVVVDGEIVARSEWDTRTIDDGHDVEIITAVQGG